MQKTVKKNQQQFVKRAKTVANFGPLPKLDPKYNFTKPNWDPEAFKAVLPVASPKLQTLLNNIDELDREDMKKHGTLFKHFIFSDQDEQGYGSRLIVAALLAHGFKNMIKTMTKVEPSADNPARRTFAYLSSLPVMVDGKETTFSDLRPVYGGEDKDGDIVFHRPDAVKLKRNAEGAMSVTGDRDYRLEFKKYVTQAFNHKANKHGEHVRFIVLSKKFKEGLDLYDVKYAHLFEALAPSEEKQAMGRGTRYCGQKNLTFKAGVGWQLHVFRYLLDLPTRFAAEHGWSTRFEDVLMSFKEELDLNSFLTTIFTEVAYAASVNRVLSAEIDHQYTYTQETAEEREARLHEDRSRSNRLAALLKTQQQ